MLIWPPDGYGVKASKTLSASVNSEIRMGMSIRPSRPANPSYLRPPDQISAFAYGDSPVPTTLARIAQRPRSTGSEPEAMICQTLGFSAATTTLLSSRSRRRSARFRVRSSFCLRAEAMFGTSGEKHARAVVAYRDKKAAADTRIVAASASHC